MGALDELAKSLKIRSLDFEKIKGGCKTAPLKKIRVEKLYVNQTVKADKLEKLHAETNKTEKVEKTDYKDSLKMSLMDLQAVAVLMNVDTNIIVDLYNRIYYLYIDNSVTTEVKEICKNILQSMVNRNATRKDINDKIRILNNKLDRSRR